MILGKLWHALMAQINKIANFFWTADPIAQMQYEYDLAVAQLKEGPRRAGAVPGAGRAGQPAGGATTSSTSANLEAKVKAYLTAGDRETAARFALELQKAKQQLAENEGQLKMHEAGLQQQRHQDQARRRRSWPTSGRRSRSTTPN